MRRISFVIHVERSTAERNGAVVNNGAKLRSHLLSNETGKCRRLLTIEVGLQTVTDGFVQENARPSRPEYDFHRTSRSINSTKLQDRLTRTLTSDGARIEIAGKNI